jgi:hypothetical protein
MATGRTPLRLQRWVSVPCGRQHLCLDHAKAVTCLTGNASKRARLVRLRVKLIFPQISCATALALNFAQLVLPLLHQHSAHLACSDLLLRRRQRRAPAREHSLVLACTCSSWGAESRSRDAGSMQGGMPACLALHERHEQLQLAALASEADLIAPHTQVCGAAESGAGLAAATRLQMLRKRLQVHAWLQAHKRQVVHGLRRNGVLGWL